jgi:hypothetical protein
MSRKYRDRAQVPESQRRFDYMIKDLSQEEGKATTGGLQVKGVGL